MHRSRTFQQLLPNERQTKVLLLYSTPPHHLLLPLLRCERRFHCKWQNPKLILMMLPQPRQLAVAEHRTWRTRAYIMFVNHKSLLGGSQCVASHVLCGHIFRFPGILRAASPSNVVYVLCDWFSAKKWLSAGAAASTDDAHPLRRRRIHQLKFLLLLVLLLLVLQVHLLCVERLETNRRDLSLN